MFHSQKLLLPDTQYWRTHATWTQLAFVVSKKKMAGRGTTIQDGGLGIEFFALIKFFYFDFLIFH